MVFPILRNETKVSHMEIRQVALENLALMEDGCFEWSEIHQF